MIAKAHQGLVLQQLVVLGEALDLPLLLDHELLALELAELGQLEPGFFLEVQRDGVNLVSQAQRRWTVIKHVAQVRFTLIVKKQQGRYKKKSAAAG